MVYEYNLESDGLGAFHSYLWVCENSSENLAQTQKGVSRVDVLSAIPVLQWTADGSEDGALHTMAQVAAIGAVEMRDGSIPLLSEPKGDLRFEVENGCLKVWSERGSAGLFQAAPWPISERLAWFLQESQTLSLVVVGGQSVWVAVALNGIDHPQIGLHQGSFQNKNYPEIVKHSKSWRFGVVGNRSLTADATDFADDHFDMYVSDGSGAQLPGALAYAGPCLGCDKEAVSREHCTPDWIASEQNVKPVTSRIFCNDCNQYFGTVLERPMADSYRAGDLDSLLGGELFAKWAIKTALTLSVAAGVRINRDWMVVLRGGGMPDGFQVFAKTDISFPGKGYSFGTTMFSAKRHAEGSVLVTFAMPDLVFAVVRATRPVEVVSPLGQVHPEVQAPDPQGWSGGGLEELHTMYFERITGAKSHFSERTGRQPQNRS